MAASAAGHRIILTVIVHDAEGRASSALDAGDFVISENGRPQSISLFRNLRPPQELIVKRPPKDYMISNRPFAAFESQQPVNVLILDTRNTDPEFQPWMRSQALRFVSMLRPDADMAFYQLAAPGLRLLHQFSHDKSHLEAAIAGVLEPATAREFERESSAGAVGLERYRQTCEAISQMARYLGRFERRKNLIWLSGDFPPVFETENKRTHSASPECAAMAITLNRANTALYPVDVRSPIATEPFQQVPPGDLGAVPRNRRGALSRDWLHTMATLAALTGGRAIENRSQLAEAMIDALNETRFAYELGFNIAPGECDGKLHALRVQMHIRDATVLAKQAFVAECGAQQADGAPPGRFDSPAIGVSVMPTVQSGAEFPVRVKVLIASSDLEWSKAGETWHASVGIRIEEMPAAGDARVLTSRRVQLASGDEKREPAAAELAVKPDAGVETLRLVVRDDTNQREGSVTFPLNNQP
jgi:VWFA-related protein